MAQTKVSLDRISNFLQGEELQEDATIILPREISNISIEIKDGVFCWDPSSRPALSGIHMKVERGMRVAVCGMVGYGKSSFLSCILGKIPKLTSEARVCGSVAYVSQSTWIQSGNIEENILFGSLMDKAKYKSVLHACLLKRDLELFSHGDQTIIGDRGINLSGGTIWDAESLGPTTVVVIAISLLRRNLEFLEDKEHLMGGALLHLNK